MRVDLYKVGQTVCRSYLSTLYKVEVIGKENIPSDKGVLLCCNHIHLLDPPLLGSYLERPIHYMAKAELFKIPVLNYLIKKFHAFPVRRGMSDKQALREGIKVLKDNNVLGIFPEGTRSKTGELGKGLAGVGFFALKTDALVVPSAIIGPYKPFGTVKVVYGKPLDFKALREEKVSSETATNYIMDAIGDLIKEHKNS
ncbi:1-acyl-sn-glycerol-3-phosphate acyltransferase [Anaerobacillus arseniciselenatis]|uniref:1-acyl-sn-glycerol-3-phosphate acyltransferase n=1 Tax=Anaerobacillus arseniciselenatis TaxID=85682 RepID=A0A1S2LUT4_9BACI|nr:1-acyl-sn-glycerol-3-phosphate acyltransferase [Anaerobacillus arseniciselenatis]